MRCPDCNKFVAYDEPEVEIQSADISSNDATVCARVVLKCADCGGELKDAEIESSMSIEHDCPKGENEKREFEWEDEPQDGDATSRTQTTDRHGKPIKLSRYMKQFYGFECGGSVKCPDCLKVISLDFSGEEQASGFNELV